LDLAGDADRFDPAIRALDTESIAHSAIDDETEPWGDAWAAATTGFEFDAGVGVPIGDDRVQFGVLGVYTSETPIDAERVDLLEEFARLISYTIRTDEWTESLRSEEPVTVEIEIDAPTEPLLALADHSRRDRSHGSLGRPTQRRQAAVLSRDQRRGRGGLPGARRRQRLHRATRDHRDGDRPRVSVSRHTADAGKHRPRVRPAVRDDHSRRRAPDDHGLPLGG